MKPTALSDLMDFVITKSRNVALMASALEAAAPILKQLQTRDRELAPSSSLDPKEIARSINLATGRPVKRVVLVSLAELQDQDRQGIDPLRNMIQGTSLCDRLIDRHSSSLWRALPDIDRYRLFRRLTDLDGSVAAPSARYAWSRIEPGFSNRVWSNVDECVYFLLGQALAGNKRKVRDLLPLCRVLAEVVPLGEHKDESGTWYILTA